MPRAVDRWQWLQLVASSHGPPSPTTRHVLHVLALHMKKNGEDCFPSEETLAERSGLSLRAVRQHLAIAHRLGWVSVTTKRLPGRKWRRNEYWPTVPDAIPRHARQGGGEERRASPQGGEERRASPQGGEERRASPQGGEERRASPQGVTNRAGEANGARGEARHSARCGTSFREVRHDVPPNSSWNLPVNSTCEGAAAVALPAPTIEHRDRGVARHRARAMLKARVPPFRVKMEVGLSDAELEEVIDELRAETA